MSGALLPGALAAEDGAQLPAPCSLGGALAHFETAAAGST